MTKDRSGERYGVLLVLNEHQGTWWKCQCDCGRIVWVNGKSLRTSIKSCQNFISAEENKKQTRTKSKHTKHINKNNDLVGKKIGKLTVIEKTDKKNSSGEYLWKCICDCGKIKYAEGSNLRRGKIKSCGCLLYKTKVELSGQRFGKLLVLKESNQRINNHEVLWECLCDCGNKTLVKTNHLISGHTLSCGCLKISKGEFKLNTIFKSLSYSFITEFTPKNLKRKLRFDFYLPDYNCYIEYDGIQHFIYTNSGWNTEEKYIETKERDSIKNQYCKEHNIKLIRIPYWDYNRLNEEYVQKALQCPLMDLSKIF